MRCGIGECARQEDADSSAWSGGAGRGIVEPNLLEFAIVIQIAPQMRILVAIEAIDLRRGKVLRQRNTRNRSQRHCCGNDREAARHNKSPWPGVVFQFLCPFERSRQEVTQAKFFWPVFPLFGVDSAGGTRPS